MEFPLPFRCGPPFTAVARECCLGAGHLIVALQALADNSREGAALDAVREPMRVPQFALGACLEGRRQVMPRTLPPRARRATARFSSENNGLNYANTHQNHPLIPPKTLFV